MMPSYFAIDVVHDVRRLLCNASTYTRSYLAVDAVGYPCLPQSQKAVAWSIDGAMSRLWGAVTLCHPAAGAFFNQVCKDHFVWGSYVALERDGGWPMVDKLLSKAADIVVPYQVEELRDLFRAAKKRGDKSLMATWIALHNHIGHGSLNEALKEMEAKA
jgi:predicted Rdx family selenoprotein